MCVLCFFIVFRTSGVYIQAEVVSSMLNVFDEQTNTPSYPCLPPAAIFAGYRGTPDRHPKSFWHRRFKTVGLEKKKHSRGRCALLGYSHRHSHVRYALAAKLGAGLRVESIRPLKYRANGRGGGGGFTRTQRNRPENKVEFCRRPLYRVRALFNLTLTVRMFGARVRPSSSVFPCAAAAECCT